MRIGLDQVRRTPREQGGQVVILFALAAVVILGVVALAVDVGMAFHQRQQYQNLATNAAVAGSYEVYGFNNNSEVPVGGTSSANKSYQVFTVMKDVIEATGATVMNSSTISGSTLVKYADTKDACTNHYKSNQVNLLAYFVDSSNNPITVSGSPQVVGRDAYPSAPSPSGVKVVSLSGCATGYFAAILRHSTFSISADATIGHGATATVVAASTQCIKGKGRVMALSTVSNANVLTLTSISPSPTPAISAAEIDDDGQAVPGNGNGDGNGNSTSALSLNTGSITGAVKVKGGIYNLSNQAKINGSDGTSGNGVNANSTAYPTTTTGVTTSDPWATPVTPTVPSATSTPTSSGSTYYFAPGHYTAAFTFASGSTYCFQPGIYIVDSTWTINTTSIYPYGDSGYTDSNGNVYNYCPAVPSASASDPGFLFYFRSSGSLQINSGGSFTNLSAYTNDANYTGLLYWQSTSDTTGDTMAGSFAGGGWYAPGAALTINSGGNAGTTTNPAAFVIANTITLNSGANINVSSQLECSPPADTTTYGPGTSGYGSGWGNYFIYGQPWTNGTAMQATLYGANATGGPAVKAGTTTASFAPTTGDLVTLATNASGGTWSSYQYSSPTAGASGTPDGVTTHDSSQVGCYNPSQTTYTIDSWLQFNHGGVGNCTSPVPAVDTTVTVPVVSNVDKNGQNPPTANCRNGGYCEYVVAIATVYVTVSSSSPLLVQGYITAVVDDPSGIIVPPPSPGSGPPVG